MLGKLLKYDLKNMILPCIPVYIGGLVLALIGMITNTNNNSIIPFTSIENLDLIIYIISGLLFTLSTFGIGCIIIFVTILISSDFYNSVFAKQGYLTHTLPVSSKDILLSKSISGFISLSLSVLIVFSLYCIVDFDFNSTKSLVISIDSHQLLLGNILIDINSITGEEYIKTIQLSGFLITLFSLILSVLTIYLSIALGHLTKYKVIGSIVALIILSNIINNIFVLPPCFLFIFEIFKNSENIFLISSEKLFLSPSILYCILASVGTIIYYFSTKKIIDGKLNLI